MVFFIKTPSISKNNAKVVVDAKINGKIKGLKYEVKLFSPEGKELTTTCEKLANSKPSYQFEVKKP